MEAENIYTPQQRPSGPPECSVPSMHWRLISLLLIALFGYFSKRHYSLHPLFPNCSRWFRHSISNQMLGRKTEPEPRAAGFLRSSSIVSEKLRETQKEKLLKGWARRFSARGKTTAETHAIHCWISMERSTGSQNKVHIVNFFQESEVLG